MALTIKECVPGGSFPTRAPHMRTAIVRSTQEALSLPWIEKLPGEKRIKVLHGQVFIIQHYVGCKLIRAHICHDEERPEKSLAMPRSH